MGAPSVRPCAPLGVLLAMLLAAFAAEIPPSSRQNAPVRFINECLSNVDCPATHYCGQNNSGFDLECDGGNCAPDVARCLPRLPAGRVCRINSGACAPGLHCAFPGTGQPVCGVQAARGEACTTTAYNPCLGGLVCSASTQKCGPRVLGRAGYACGYTDSKCDQAGGFYCRTRDGVCAAKRGPGEPCDRAADNFECRGFCLRRLTAPVCAASRKPGQLCSEDRQCEDGPINDPRRVRMLCNAPRGTSSRTGICAREDRLIAAAGAGCDPHLDLCDGRRNLRCERTGARFACVQRSGLGGPCTRGSVYSVCETTRDGVWLECRRRLSLTGKKQTGGDVCARLPEMVPLGGICNRAEFARCPRGAECVTADAVVDAGGRFAPPKIAYCVRRVPEGGACGARFRTACAKGLVCVAGKCQKGAQHKPPLQLLSGINMECETRPCARELVCSSTRGQRVCYRGGQCRSKVGQPLCVLPEIPGKLWGDCANRAASTVACPIWTACTRALEWAGIKKCRPLGGVGAFCESDNGCKGKLKCRPAENVDPIRKRICYDLKKAIPLGSSCDPKKSGCAVDKPGYQAASCLAKGKVGYACQTKAQLFENCSSKKNIGCAEGLTCSAHAVCTPTSPDVNQI